MKEISRAWRMSDPGIKVVGDIYKSMSIDEEWSVREPRGFSWWAKDFRQSVWATRSFDDDGVRAFRVHIRTDVWRGFKPSPKNLASLNELSIENSVNGFIRSESDPSLIQIAACMTVYEENLSYVKRLSNLAAALQICEAQRLGFDMARRVAARPAVTSHPHNGKRETPDDMLNVLEQLILPRGRLPRVWSDADFREVAKQMECPPVVVVTGDDNGVTAEFPFLHVTSLFESEGREEHPLLGRGVFMKLQLPSQPEGDPNEVALRWNEREIGSQIRCHFLGGWRNNDGMRFVTFLPNCLGGGDGLLTNLAWSMAQRAKWIAESEFGDDWTQSFDENGQPRVWSSADSASLFSNLLDTAEDRRQKHPNRAFTLKERKAALLQYLRKKLDELS